MPNGLVYFSMLLGLLSGSANAQLPTKATGTITETCAKFAGRMNDDLGKFAQLLYGPEMWGYGDVPGGIEVRYGDAAAVLDSFNYSPDESKITYKYQSLPPSLAQGVNTDGTVIEMLLADEPGSCTLTTSYILPAPIANNYVAKLYYAGVLYSIIDNAQMEIGGANCGPYPAPTMACHVEKAASFRALRRETNTADPVYTGDGPSNQDYPSARTVSNAVCEQGDDVTGTSNRLSSLFTIYGQFLDHDLSLTPGGEGAWHQDWDIPVEPEDPLYSPEGLRFSRSRYMRKDNTTPQPRNHINTITALIDGSQVYGNTWEKLFALRTFEGGKLRTSAGGNLPPRNGEDMQGVRVKMDPNPDLEGIYACGDQRANENEVLLSIHTLFIKEHNKVCDELVGVLGAGASDEELFQYARRVVIAELQAITFREWLPLFLGNFGAPSYLQRGGNKDPQISAAFSTAAFRFGHSMVTETLDRLGPGLEPIAQGPQELPKSLFNFREIEELGTEVYLRGAMHQPARNLDNKIVTQLRNILFRQTGFDGLAGVDLPSLNIQRGRDHGIPSYSAMKGTGRMEAFRFNSGFRDGCNDGFKAAYGDNWQEEDLELFPAGLCESPDRFSLVGPTFSKIINDQFERVRDADPFWFTNLTRDFPKLRQYARARQIQSGTIKIGEIIVRNTKVTDAELPSMRTAFQVDRAPINPVFPIFDNDRFDELLEAIIDGDATQAGLGNASQVRDEARDILDPQSGVVNEALAEASELGTFNK